jgi:LmbE family N-acetylglucosaminyl deacetylase
METPAPLLGRTLVIVAHPDDETLGCGALLQRMREPRVVFCTDGAPRNRYFWASHGSREAYAQARRREAREALAIVGIDGCDFLPAAECPGAFLDQDLFLAVPEALRALAELIARHHPEALLSHAYEGGHPDHDACSFLTSVAAREHHLPAWEFPLYHRTPEGEMRRQEFLQLNGSEVLLDITAEETERKGRMVGCYLSQGSRLEGFHPAIERLRPMAAYDFTCPPHEGPLNYEVWQWPVSGAQVAGALCACRAKREPRELEAPGPGVREVA